MSPFDKVQDSTDEKKMKLKEQFGHFMNNQFPLR